MKKPCLHSIFWTNGQILTKLSQIQPWEDLKILLDFGYSHIIFKITKFITRIFWTIDQILTKLAQRQHFEDLKKLSDFGDLDLIFMVASVI